MFVRAAQRSAGEGWRMASTAIRLAIFAASGDAFYLLIDGLRFKTSLC